MTSSLHSPIINWSVWDRNPIVSWIFDDISTSVSMRLPPVAVCHLQSLQLMAVVGNFAEFGSENLFLYSYDGALKHRFTAPNLGKDTQFVGVQEKDREMQVIVGFQVNEQWKEQAGRMNIADGAISDYHRNY